MKLRLPRRRRFDLRKAAFILPNLFTVSSIFCGFYAAVTAASAVGDDANQALYRACIAVFFGMIFDSVDGRVARLTRTQSAFGVQMDSLADVITFGVAPGLIAWHWSLHTFGTVGLFACFLYCAAGTVRLARFNVMAAASSEPSDYFLGLPIPAAAGLLVAMIIASLRSNYLPSPEDWWAPVIIVSLGILMVSNVRFRTFKATKMTIPIFSALMIFFAGLIALAYQTDPSIAILTLMGVYLLFGLGESTIRLFREEDDPEEEGDDDFELELLDPLLEDGEEELID
jgi:CDP-diacylglycerol---serine O-phosphatidyltransferase